MKNMRAMSNPPNPYESTHRDLLEPASSARLELYDDATREILSRNDSPDLSFRWSVNPYRGVFMLAHIVMLGRRMNIGASGRELISSRRSSSSVMRRNCCVGRSKTHPGEGS